MRIRIALTTAVAVMFIISAVLFTVFANMSGASARATRHVAGSRERPAAISMKLTSYSKAQQASKIAGYADAVEKQKEEAYLNEAAYLKAQQQNTIPPAWIPTAVCEEDGRDDAYAGYFGILEWNGFDGYPTTGGARVRAAGLGGRPRPRPARCPRRVPQLLIDPDRLVRPRSSPSGPTDRQPPPKMALTCAMSK